MAYIMDTNEEERIKVPYGGIIFSFSNIYRIETDRNSTPDAGNNSGGWKSAL